MLFCFDSFFGLFCFVSVFRYFDSFLFIVIIVTVFFHFVFRIVSFMFEQNFVFAIRFVSSLFRGVSFCFICVFHNVHFIFISLFVIVSLHSESCRLCIRSVPLNYLPYMIMFLFTSVSWYCWPCFWAAAGVLPGLWAA